MQTIWKYVLDVTDKSEIEMPVGARMLSVAVQHNTICVWVLVNPDVEQGVRCFSMYGTGHIHHSITGVFIGTVQLLDGNLVYHVFDNGYK